MWFKRKVRVKWTRCYGNLVSPEDLLPLVFPLISSDYAGRRQSLQGELLNGILGLILEYLPVETSETFNMAYQPYPYKYSPISPPSLSDFDVKLLIIGDTKVGKTLLIRRFFDNSFAQKFATVPVHTLCINDKLVNVRIFDTTGGEKFRSLIYNYYNSVMGVIIVYDITRKHSFANLDGWITSMQEKAPAELVKMLIGNKLDLANRFGQREVERDCGTVLADELEVPFFEVSAKTGENVLLAFSSIVRDIVQRVKRDGKGVTIDQSVKFVKCGCVR